MSKLLDYYDLVNSSESRGSTLLQLEDVSNNFSSSNFSGRETTLNNLFTTKVQETLFSKEPILKEVDAIKDIWHGSRSDTVTLLHGWKNIENISARLIEAYDDIVVLECLIDKENKIYEEREFRKSLFTGYDLKLGNLFYLRFFDRPNETKMEIHNDPRLTSQDDFPKKKYADIFKKSNLFK